MKKEINVQDVKIRKCTIKDVDDIYCVQNRVIEYFNEQEKGYFLPFQKESYLRIVQNPLTDGEIYGAFIKNEMIGWIFLSISDRMKEIKSYIPTINGTCADVDGVLVLPKYRGYGIQILLIQYLEKQALQKNINHIVAEITFGNDYSLNNFLKLGYEIKTWYLKDNSIKRHILLKTLNKGGKIWKK